MLNLFINTPTNKKLLSLVVGAVLITPSLSFAQDYPIVQMIKRNASSFAIDGNRGGETGQNVYIYNESERNVNQQWFEIDRGNGFYSYQKVRTDFCLDGNRGGERAQNVYLWECRDNNFNQHWLKVDVGNGHYRLEKRNAPGFSLDGGAGGENEQNLYLWSSNDRNQNQHWFFNQVSAGSNNGGGGASIPTTAPAPETVDYNVSNLFELRDAVRRNNQDIVMKPGNYSITELPANNDRYFHVSGNNNTIDLTGVHLDFPVHIDTPEAHFHFSGRGNTLIGGTIENTYNSGLSEVIDYVSYNVERDFLANGGKPHLVIAGNDTTIIDTKMIVRGSFPYGYGSYFGIGGRNSFGLDKRGGIQINSTNTILDGVHLKMEAFSHGIYIGPGEGAVTDNTIIRNTTVEGNVRLTNDILSDTGNGSLIERNNFRDSDGNRIPSNDAESLSEDGIRSYRDSGSVFVENSTVKGMRSGIRLWLGTETRVTNTTSIDNRIANVSMNRDGVVDGVTANFTYGPALLVDGSEQNQDIDMTLLASPNAVGSHNIADIRRESEIVFRRSPGARVDSAEDRVIMVTADNAKITNHTEYTIELASGTRGNEIISAGNVIDRGSNDVRFINLER